MSQLERTIDMIVGNIRARKFANETAVREAIVMPVLAALGWETLIQISSTENIKSKIAALTTDLWRWEPRQR